MRFSRIARYPERKSLPDCLLDMLPEPPLNKLIT
jgi:hypothetical protein